MKQVTESVSNITDTVMNERRCDDQCDGVRNDVGMNSGFA